MTVQIVSLQNEILALPKTNDLKIKKKRRKLKRKLELIVSDRLLATSTPYKTLFLENLELLENNELTFKVYSQGASPFDQSTTAMKGKLDTNGHIYLSQDHENENFFSSGICPEGFTGTINALGRISIKAKKEKMQFFIGGTDKVAVSYKGSINKSGEISMVLQRSKITFKRNRFIDKMICGFFPKQSVDKISFFKNKRELLTMISEEINEVMKRSIS